MLPKSGSRLPKSPPFSDLEIADLIGRVLFDELGGTRRATKTVMRWTGVSERAARAWINGESCPSCRHLILLSSKSTSVLGAVLKMAGQEQLAISVDLASIERELENLAARIRLLRHPSS